MYSVILVNDEKRNKNYYGGYSKDLEFGNIVVEKLPPEQDDEKAHAYYWDSENEEWIYDESKYAGDVEEKEEAEKEAIQNPAINTKLELFASLIEVDEVPEMTEKIGYTWKQKCKLIDGIPHILWEQDKDPNYDEVIKKDGSSKERAIVWFKGNKVTKDLWYEVEVAGNFKQALKTGFPSSRYDSKYFEQ